MNNLSEYKGASRPDALSPQGPGMIRIRFKVCYTTNPIS